MEFGQVVYMEPCTLYIDFIILLSLSLSLSLFNHSILQARSKFTAASVLLFPYHFPSQNSLPCSMQGSYAPSSFTELVINVEVTTPPLKQRQ